MFGASILSSNSTVTTVEVDPSGAVSTSGPRRSLKSLGSQIIEQQIRKDGKNAIAIQELVEIMPELKSFCSKVDVNNDGSLCAAELVAVFSELEHAHERHLREKYKRQMVQAGFLGFVLLVLILIGAMFPLVLGANEYSKETHATPDGILTSSDGLNIVKTTEAKEAVPLILLPVMDMETLNQIKMFSVTIYQGSGDISSIPFFPSGEAAYKVTMMVSKVAWANKTTVQLETPSGDILRVHGGETILHMKTMNGDTPQMIPYKVCDSNAHCSSVKVEGIDQEAMMAEANQALWEAGFASNYDEEGQGANVRKMSWTCW